MRAPSDPLSRRDPLEAKTMRSQRMSIIGYIQTRIYVFLRHLRSHALEMINSVFNVESVNFSKGECWGAPKREISKGGYLAQKGHSPTYRLEHFDGWGDFHVFPSEGLERVDG